ncbi:MAG: hypothetical protein U9N81_08490, partial [Bacillota bacterium]|nr:hypothetical protein [Bacillota bacterium]
QEMGLPKLQSKYDDERFFKELSEFLKHAEYLSFYGGEPFLVKEHLRIFDMLIQMNIACRLFVNTNCCVLTEKTKTYIKKLNFFAIAVSRDSMIPQLHEKIRCGLHDDAYRKNLDWVIDYCKHNNVYLSINTTEHRKNWFDIPQIFYWAEKINIPVHICHCIYPENVSLYTLPTNQLQYVTNYFVRWRERFCESFPKTNPLNRRSFDFLVNLCKKELSNRDENWKYTVTAPNLINENKVDSSLGIPMIGYAPFNSEESILQEIDYAVSLLGNDSMEMLTSFREESFSENVNNALDKKLN